MTILLFFQFGFFLFLFFSDGHGFYSILLNPCLVPDLRGNVFSFSQLSMMLVVHLSCMAFIMLWYVSSLPTFWRVFIINGWWISSKNLSASIEIIIWFLFFSLIRCITLIFLQMLNHLYTPGINTTWSWCMVLLIMQYFVEDF